MDFDTIDDSEATRKALEKRKRLLEDKLKKEQTPTTESGQIAATASSSGLSSGNTSVTDMSSSTSGSSGGVSKKPRTTRSGSSASQPASVTPSSDANAKGGNNDDDSDGSSPSLVVGKNDFRAPGAPTISSQALQPAPEFLFSEQEHCDSILSMRKDKLHKLAEKLRVPVTKDSPVSHTRVAILRVIGTSDSISFNEKSAIFTFKKMVLQPFAKPATPAQA